MRHIKLKDLINESYIANTDSKKTVNENIMLERQLAEAFEHDLKRLEETLISEGFGDVWNKIKQKGGEIAQGAKQALLKPLLKIVIDKIAKDDPEGLAKLTNAAKTNPASIEKLMDNPAIKAKEKEVSKELSSIQEMLTEDEHEEIFQEYVDKVLEEARVLRDDPRNVRRRERAAQRRQAKAAPDLKVGDHGYTAAYAKARGGKVATKVDPKKTNPKKVDPKKENPPVKNKDQVAPSSDTPPEQNKGGDDKEKGGEPQSLVKKVYAFAKKHPKLSAVVGVALLGVIAAAAVGSGGVIPLITSTLVGAATGAVKGAGIGAAVGGGKEAIGQFLKGDGMDWKKVGNASLQGGKTGAKVGAIAGAGANVAGKAIAGVGKAASWASNLFGGAKGAKGNSGVDNHSAGSGHGAQRSHGTTRNSYEIAHDEVVPGQPLNQRQLQAMKMATDMSPKNLTNYQQNLTPDQMKQFNDWNQQSTSVAPGIHKDSAGNPSDDGDTNNTRPNQSGGGNAQNPVGNNISKQIQAARTDPDAIDAWHKELQTNPIWKKNISDATQEIANNKSELSNAIQNDADSKTIADIKAKLYNNQQTFSDLQNNPNHNWLRTYVTGEEHPVTAATRRMADRDPQFAKELDTWIKSKS